jgi:hypothetical protein
LNAVTQGLQAEAMAGWDQKSDLNSMVVRSLSFSCGSFVLALVVFFLFPLVQGGILGRVRDRIDTPELPPGQLRTYGRIFYDRLLGSYGLYVLVLIALLLPTMSIGFGTAFQQITKAMPAVTAEKSLQQLWDLTTGKELPRGGCPT